MLFLVFGIFVSFDLRFGFLFAYSVRQLGLHLPFLIAGVATELGEILEPESQPKAKNIAEATIRHRVQRAKVPPSGERGAGLGFSD